MILPQKRDVSNDSIIRLFNITNFNVF
jgi:hypothetical protein